MRAGRAPCTIGPRIAGHPSRAHDPPHTHDRRAACAAIAGGILGESPQFLMPAVRSMPVPRRFQDGSPQTQAQSRARRRRSLVLVRDRTRMPGRHRARPAAGATRDCGAARPPRRRLARKAAALAGPDQARPRRRPPAVANGNRLLSTIISTYTTTTSKSVKALLLPRPWASSRTAATLPGHNYLYVPTGGCSTLGFMPADAGPPEQSCGPPREAGPLLHRPDVDQAHSGPDRQGRLSLDQEPQDMPWGHRLAFRSRTPKGRRVCLAQIIRR